MLRLYRSALRLRRSTEGLGDGPMRWLDTPDGVLAFLRGGQFVCVVNLSGEDYDLRELLPEFDVLLSSITSVSWGSLPPDAAVWLRYHRAPWDGLGTQGTSAM
jgi:alpha-glucosidase